MIINDHSCKILYLIKLYFSEEIFKQVFDNKLNLYIIWNVNIWYLEKWNKSTDNADMNVFRQTSEMAINTSTPLSKSID